jgi:acetylcholinesterase
MYYSILPISVAFLVAAISSVAGLTLGKRVDLGYATYQSLTNGLGISEFLGMRFAAPPLGDLRFRAPRDPLNETGIIEAYSVRAPFIP